MIINYLNSLLRNFCLAQNDEKFLYEVYFTSNAIYGEYMARIDMNENNIT